MCAAQLAQAVSRAKFVQFGLTPELLEQIRAEAKRQDISVSELIRRAIRYFLNACRGYSRFTPVSNHMPKNTFELHWTKAEEEYADRVIQQHFDEDR